MNNDIIAFFSHLDNIERSTAALRALAGKYLKDAPSQPEPENPAPTPPQGGSEAWKQYLKDYPDVARVPKYNSPEGAWEHYQKYGKKEGRGWGEVEEVDGEYDFHHYNYSAFHDQYTAVILELDEKASAVSIEGRNMGYHGWDKGRQVWKIRGTKRDGWLIIRFKSGRRSQVKIPPYSGEQMLKGKHWGKKRE